MKTLLKGGTVVSGSKTAAADVLMEDGKILAVEQEIDEGDAKIIDVSGRLLFPGFIDAPYSF